MSNEFRCPTVTIKSDESPDGYIVINESDFNPTKHERFVTPPPAMLSPLLPPPEVPA